MTEITVELPEGKGHLRYPSEHERIQALMQSGETERLHAIPHHGSYNTGFHSWGVAMIITLLHPSPSANLLKLALLHDAAEKYIGDSPSSMKWMGPNGVATRRFYKETEHEVNKALNVYNIVGVVSDDEQMWLHGADMLEFLFWCRRQLNMGNQNVVHVCRNSFNAIEEGFHKGAIPEQIYDAALFLTGVQTGELHRFGENK